MKSKSAVLFSSIIFCAALAAAPAFAGDTGGKGKGAKKGEPWEAALTEEEKTQYHAAKEKALADDASLKQKSDDLTALRDKAKGGDADAKKEMMQATKDLKTAMDAALVKADPGMQAVLDKRDAWMKENMKGKGGGKKADTAN